ncbi:MAG TPA: hypothetical protein VLH94_02960 [Spirochaetia bacterium]|nr:hypothetical protein [Spirochaetia bacterium]
MKAVVYITKKTVWVGNESFDWDGVRLDEVFGKIKRELKVNEVRVVLGHEVSSVTAIKAGNTFLTRENILKLVKPWMPFEIDNDCFDWKLVVLGHDEVWIQIVAMERGLLLSLSSAIRNNGLKVDLVTAIGVLLGEESNGREIPVVYKWENKEKISVLAVNGLVDLVTSNISNEDLMVYANKKWRLAVNPEEIIMKEENFNLSKKIFSIKTKGEDKAVLNLPILKEVVSKMKPESEKRGDDEILEMSIFVDRTGVTLNYLLIFLITVLVGLIVLIGYLIFRSRLL